MENSEKDKTVLSRVTKNTDGSITVAYDSKKVTFNAYQRGVMLANVEYRSQDVFNKLAGYISAAEAATALDKATKYKQLEEYLNEIINTMEILDIQ